MLTLPELENYFPIHFFILAIASVVASWVAKAVRRKYPSPLGPKPTPGVPTTWHSSNRRSKNSHDEWNHSGPMVRIQTYGPLTPPYAGIPASSSASFIMRAFS